MTHAGHRAYKKVDQRNRPCDLAELGLTQVPPLHIQLNDYNPIEILKAKK